MDSQGNSLGSPEDITSQTGSQSRVEQRLAMLKSQNLSSQQNKPVKQSMTTNKVLDQEIFQFVTGRCTLMLNRRFSSYSIL